jgi:hypothetical protein
LPRRGLSVRRPPAGIISVRKFLYISIIRTVGPSLYEATSLNNAREEDPKGKLI